MCILLLLPLLFIQSMSAPPTPKTSRVSVFKLLNMAMKSHVFLLVSFLLLATSISSNEQQAVSLFTSPLLQSTYVATSPVPPKTAQPPPTTPTTPTPPAVKPPTTAPPVVKPPTTATPVAKPPTATPTVAKPPTAAPPTPPRNTKECYPPCVVRCKLHSRQNVCLRACVTCCDRCKCVPPGQSGNQEVCGKCYTNMKTHGGRTKCP